MLPAKRQVTPVRKDGRVILHFDYDCFYASVFESENPELKDRPLAVQQKQIIVTCNLVARQRGLRKLQLIEDARKTCPDVVIVLGEDISRFRDASKKLYRFLRDYSWNDRAERLGFDEVWLDVTDMIDYNLSLLNSNDLVNSFFILTKDDPTNGFLYNATCFAGPTFPEVRECEDLPQDQQILAQRLRLGSHLAAHVRCELQRETGYTSSVGVSTSKLLSKLVGNLHKPKNQTTLIPPYTCQNGKADNIEAFMDDFEVGKIPGIGFKLAQKVRQHVLQHDAEFEKGLIYGATKENVTVRDVRHFRDMNSETLEKLLSGPGSPHGIGVKIWSLLHGVDDSEVNFAKAVPSQVSIEDSYIRLDTLSEVLKELKMLSCSLIERMRIDLVAEADDCERPSRTSADQVALDADNEMDKPLRKWLAHPKTIRLSTRPRLPLKPDGSRTRSFKRISNSAPLPNFVFSLTEPAERLAERLVQESLITMFRKLHSEKSGWNLSLVNIAVTNMAETGGESRTASGRNIGNMFKRQESVLKEFRVYDDEETKSPIEQSAEQKPEEHISVVRQSPVVDTLPNASGDNAWVEEDVDDDGERCGFCGILLPPFAMPAHKRYHLLGG